MPREPIPAELMELPPPQFDLDGPLRKDASVIEERVSWWTIKHDERASETSLGLSAGHSPLVFGGRAVGTRTGSPVRCLFDPSW